MQPCNTCTQTSAVTALRRRPTVYIEQSMRHTLQRGTALPPSVNDGQLHFIAVSEFVIYNNNTSIVMKEYYQKHVYLCLEMTIQISFKNISNS